MTLYIVISALLILGSIMYFDFEFSQLRGSRGKVGGQIAFAIWYALTTALAMAIPIIIESLGHISAIKQFLISCGFYIIWFLFARILFGYAMRMVYGKSVNCEYRRRVAADAY